MRAVLQRVRWAEVEADGNVVGKIDHGLLVYVAAGPGDGAAQAEQMAEKIAGLRVFPDKQDKLNLSVRDVRGGVLAVPNFTLLADARKGRRPAFGAAAPATVAEPVFDAFVLTLGKMGVAVAAGIFGASMLIRSSADGPVNIVLDIPPLRRASRDGEV